MKQGGADQRHTVRVWLYGAEFDLDLDRCREAMVFRVAELGTPGAVAEAAEVSRRTLEHLLAGERVGVLSLTSIITKGLKLDVPDVLHRVEKSA